MIKPIPVKPKEIKPKPVIVKSIGLFRGKKAVFGLNAVQAFFAIILGLAILAYVIVILMGILGNAMIIPHNTVTIYNELGYINQTVDTFNQKINSTYTNPTNCRVLNAINYSSGLVISSGNYTINYAGCLWTNSTNVTWNNVTFNYTMEYDSNAQNQLNSITGNTSTGTGRICWR